MAKVGAHPSMANLRKRVVLYLIFYRKPTSTVSTQALLRLNVDPIDHIGLKDPIDLIDPVDPVDSIDYKDLVDPVDPVAE